MPVTRGVTGTRESSVSRPREPLPLRGRGVRPVPVADLLPPSVDVAENVRRVEGIDEEGREAEDRCEYDDLAEDARHGGSLRG